MLAFGMFAISWSEFEVAEAKLFIGRCKRNKWVKYTKWSNPWLKTSVNCLLFKNSLARKAVFFEQTLPQKFICFVLPVIVLLLRKVDPSLREMCFTPRRPQTHEWWNFAFCIFSKENVRQVTRIFCASSQKPLGRIGWNLAKMMWDR